MERPLKFVPFLLLAIPALMMLAQCSKSNDEDDPPTPPDPLKPYLTVTQTLPASFGSPGGSASIIFSTNESWEITIEPIPEKNSTQTALAPPENPSADTIAVVTARNSASSVKWYEITPLSGVAGKDLVVTVSVQPNEEYTDRIVALVLRGKTLEKRIEITQLKKNAIIIGDNRLEITSAEQTLTVKIQSNVTYSIVVKQGDGWIHENPKSRAGGLKEEEYTFTISANPLAEERTGIVVFQDTNSDLFDELTIVQATKELDPQRTALRAIYDTAGGDGWTQKQNWCSDKPLNEWYGVETDTDGNVTVLRLPKNNLTGTVSWEVAKLTKLRHLDLSHNELEGPISVSEGPNINSYLDFLTEAETINLSHNRLTGDFLPIDGQKLLQLKSLDLSSNQLRGYAFPVKWESMFQNGRTVDLILNDNYLHDQVPAVIQNHPQWSRLALQFIRQYHDGGIEYSKDIRLPDFTFTDLRDGSQASIRDVYSGNTLTMVLHWNPLEEDSKTFMQTTVRRFHTLFGQQGFAVVAITPEGEKYKQAAEQYLREYDVPYPVVTDYADAQGRRIILPAEPYPSYFLVDQYGKVSNDMFTGQYCNTSLYPEEPFLIDLTERPFQHTDNLNKVFKNTFGNIKYQSSEFSMDMIYETLQRATKGKGIDIVLIGEAYTDVDIATGYYKQVMEFAKEALFAIEPMKSYRDYFNIHLVYAVSRDAFISKSGGSTALGVTPQDNAWFYTNTAVYILPDYYRVVAAGISTVGVVINGRGGGVTQLQYDVVGPNFAFTGFGNRTGFREDFIHETVGHGFGFLGDEYSKSGSDGKPQGEIPESEKKKLTSANNNGWFLNLSLTDDPKSVNWSHLIGHTQYPYVGIYQGGYYHTLGVWRSENQSIMDQPTDYYFNTICRELIVRRIMELAGEEYTFEKFLAKDSDEGRQKSTFQNSQLIQKPQNRHQPPIIRDLTDR